MTSKRLPQTMIAIAAPVEITAAEAGDDGKPKGPARFRTEFYTGGQMSVSGWDLPVVVDLSGIKKRNVLVANLDHDNSKRVGNFELENTGTSLIANGTATAANPARDEVVASAIDGYVWQSSLEVSPSVVETVEANDEAEANGQTFVGPVYIARQSELSGFAFVSHGADDNTKVSIAAKAAKPPLENTKMDTKLKTWIEAMGFDVDELSADQLEGLEANYNGQNKGKVKASKPGNPFEARKLEAKRRREFREIADRQIEMRNSDEDEIIAIETMHDHAIAAGMTTEQFRLDLYEAMVPMSVPIRCSTKSKITKDVLGAAICQAGRLPDIEKHYSDKTLQAAHDEFKGRIGLKQLLLLGAQENDRSYKSNHSSEVNATTLRAAFAPVQGAFSTLDIPDVVAATANKFIMRGWDSVDQTCLRIAKIQSVRDFKTITTVSLTDTVIYEKVGSDGQIKHGTLGDLTYTNKADTYARMLAITRQDIINDDLGALTDVPMKLGNGAMKKLNDIFWTEFLGLVGASFFAAGNSNINTGVATMSEAGLDATYVIFKNQTNPDGTPLGSEPTILLVPTALEGAARRLTRSEQFVTGATTMEGSSNIWANRFEVLSSPYISNSSYTGNTSVAWWMLGNPEMLPVIAIAALNGQVEPTVDTAEADFNVLGIQMRGYSDVGVADQEYRGGVHADGGAS